MARLKHPTARLLVDTRTPVPEVIVYVRHLVTVLAGNPFVTTPSIPLATVSADADGLHTAHAAALTRARGTADARNRKLATVFTDMGRLRTDVQTAIDADPEHGAEIVAACGMTLKKAAKRNKARIAARMTNVPGAAKLMAKAVKRRAAYEWEMSSDGGKTWVTVARSTVANATVSGLTAGTTYLFRFRSTVGQVTSDWCDPITFMAH